MSSFSYTESALYNAPEKGKIKRVEKITKFSIKIYNGTWEGINILHIFLIFLLFISRTIFYLGYSNFYFLKVFCTFKHPIMTDKLIKSYCLKKSPTSELIRWQILETWNSFWTTKLVISSNDKTKQDVDFHIYMYVYLYMQL